MTQTVNLTPNVRGILRWAKSGLRAEPSMRTRSARALLDVVAASVEYVGASIGASPCDVLTGADHLPSTVVVHLPGCFQRLSADEYRTYCANRAEWEV